MRISTAAIAAVILALIVVSVPQSSGAQLEPRISLYPSSHDFSLTASDNITANPVRNLPPVVYPGSTFNVTVNFTSPLDNFSAPVITDHAPQGWTVEVKKVWCSPPPFMALATNTATENKIEVLWPGLDYPNGTNFTALYKVTVPGDASPVDYAFSGTLYFHYDPDNPLETITEPIGGDGTIAVHLPGPPQLSFAPAEYSFQGVEQGSNPAGAVLRIWNSGGEVLNWSVSDNATWLSMNPTSGNSTGEIDIVNIAVNTSGLAAGEYLANITITPEGANATSLPVNLTIIPPANPVRNLPIVAYPGSTFDVWVNWTLNATLPQNVSGIALVDNTTVTNATGTYLWDNVVQISETPAAADKQVRGTNNTSVEYLWDANYTPGTTFSVHYRVTVPFSATPGIYNMTHFPDNATAWLEYYVGEDVYIECIGGDWQQDVLSLPSPVRNLPPTVHCGETFDVIVNWSSPVDDLNAIGFTNLAPDIPANWNVTADLANCTPVPDFAKATGNKIEYAWNGSYSAGTNFTIRYKVTVPANPPLGVYFFPYDNCSLSWMECYIGEIGPYKSCTIGEYLVNVTGYNLTVVSDGCCNITVSGAGINDTVPAGGNQTYYNITCGANVTVYANDSDVCCLFVNWTVDGSFTPGNPINVTMDSDHTAVATCIVPIYNLTVNVAPVGAGNVTINGTIPPSYPNITTWSCGAVVNLTATPDVGYHFVNWTGDTGTIGDVNASNTTITMNANYSITASFAINTYNLTINSTAGGNVTIPGEGVFGPYDHGTVVNLTATPDAGYHFVNWTGNVGTIADPNAASTNITMNGAYSITANFAINTYNLTINSTAGGNVTIPGEGVFGPYDHGTVVNLTATPDAGYHFVNWTGNVGTIADPNAASTNITMNGAYSITANFAINTYNLTINSTAGGNVTIPGEGVFGPYDHGTVVNLTATPDVGYHFVNWTGDNGTIGDVNAASTNITMNGAYSITANFAINTYNLTINSTAGGNVTDPGEGVFGPYDHGTVVNLTATPDVGYHFVNWTGDTGTIGDVNASNTTITMNGAYSITANFAINAYNLTINSTAGGNVTIPGEGVFGPYDHGTVVNLTATPDVGYHFVNWTGDTGTIGDVNASNTTITMLGAYSITANFAINTYNLTINSTAGGNVTIPGEGVFGPYDHGTVVNLTATPDSGYRFDGWTGDVGTIGDVNAATTTITMNASYSITANFARVAPPGPGGGGGGAPPPPPVCCPCDVNCDGFFDARDLTEEHRIILLLDAPTEGADCTQDGEIDSRDITGVKRAILGICCWPCDPNCDGVIDARDVTKMHRIIAGIDNATAGADCNGDGRVDVRDLTVIKQIVVEVQKKPQPVIVSPCGCFQ